MILKKFILYQIFVTILFINISHTETKRAIATGDWSSPSMWSPIGVPTSSDSVIIDQTGTGEQITVTISNSNVLCKSLSVSPTNLETESVLQISNGKILTVNNKIFIAQNGTLEIVSGTINIAGDFELRGNFISGTNNNIRFFGGNLTQQILGTIVPVFSNLIINKVVGTQVKLSINTNVSNNFIDSSGIFDIQSFLFSRTTIGGSFFLGDNGEIKIGGTNSFPINFSTYTLLKLSTTTFYGTSQTIVNRNYGNLIIAGSGTKTTSESIVINGNFTINNGTTFSGGSNRNHKFYGNFINNGNFTVSTNTEVEFGGIQEQTISGNSTTFRNLKINKTNSSLTLQTNILINNGKIVVSTGTFNLSTFTANRITSGDSLAIYDGILKMSGTNNFPNNFQSVYFSTTSTCEFNSQSSQNIPTYIYGNLKIGGNGSKIISNPIQIFGNIEIDTFATLQNLSELNSISISKNLICNGKFENAGTTNFVSNTIFSGNGILKFSIIQISGILNDGGKTFYIHKNFTNNGIYTSSGTAIFDSTFEQTISQTNFYNLIVNKNNSSVKLLGNVSLQNNFTLQNGTFSTENNTFTVSKNLEIQNGIFNPTSSQISIGGNFICDGVFQYGNSTLNLNGTTQQLFDGIIFFNLSLSGTGKKIQQKRNSTIFGNLSIDANTEFNDNGFSDTLLGNLINNSKIYSTGKIIFNGNTTISGNGSFKFFDISILTNANLVATGKTFFVKGNWENFGNFTSCDSVIFDSTLSQIVTTGKFKNFIVRKTPGDIILNNNDTIFNDLKIESGNLNTNGISNLIVGNNINISSNGNLKSNSTSIFVGGNWENNGTFQNDFSTIIFNKNGNQNINFTHFYNLIVNGSGNKIFTNGFQTNGNFSIYQNSNCIDTSNSTTTINGNLIVSGSFIHSNGNLNFSGNTTLSGDGTIQFGNVNITNILNDGGKNIFVKGNWNKTGTFVAIGKLIFNGSLSQTISTSNFFDFEISKTQNTVTLNGELTIDNDFKINIGTISTGNLNNKINVFGSVDIAQNGVLIANSSEIYVSGNWKRNGVFNSGNSTVIFNGTSEESLYTSNFYNVKFANGGSKAKLIVGNSYSVANNFTIENTTVVLESGTITIGGNWTNNGTFNSITGTVAMNKNGNANFSGTTTFNSFIIEPQTTIKIDSLSKIIISESGNLTENGYIVGKLECSQKMTIPNTNYNFGNIGVEINFTNSSPDTIQIIRTTGTTPIGLNQSITRHFEVNAKNNSNLNLKFYYKSIKELNGEIENKLKVWSKESQFISWNKKNSQVDTLNEFLNISDLVSKKIYGFSSTEVRTFAIENGNWNDSSSWSPSGIPTIEDSVLIPLNKVTLIYQDEITQIKSINILGTLNLSQNSQLKIFGHWKNSGTFSSNVGKVIFNGINQTIGNSKFYDIQFSNSGTKTAIGTFDVNGSVEIDSNVIFNGGLFGHTFAKNFITNGQFISMGQIIFDGNEPQTISKNKFNNVVFTGSGIKTFTGEIDIDGFISINANTTVDAQTFSHKINGDFSKHSTATFLHSIGTITFNGANQNISGINIGNVIFAGNGTKNIIGNLVINGNLTIEQNVTFKPNNSIDTVYGNWTNNGTFDSANSTICFNGNNQTINSSNFNNLILSGNEITFTGIINVAQNFGIENNCEVDGGIFTHTFYGNWTNNGRYIPNFSTVKFVKNGTVNFLGNTDVYNLIINSGTTLNVDSNSTINLIEELTENGYLNGKIKKTEFISTTGVPFSFGGIGSTLIVGGSLPDSVTIISIRKKIPIGFVSNQAIQRYYEVKTKNQITSANLGLVYDETNELNSQNETTLKIWKSINNGISWAREIGSIININLDSISFTTSIDSNAIFAISSSSVKTFAQQSGNWNNSDFWSPSGIPTINDSVYISFGKSVTISGNDSVVCFGLYNNGTLTFENDGKIVIAGGFTNSGTINSNLETAYFSGSPTIFNGTANFYNIVISQLRTLKMNQNSHLKIAGTFTKIGNLDISSFSPNYIEYNSSQPNQTIAALSYNNLILSNGGNKTTAEKIYVSQKFQIGTNTIFSDNNDTVEVKDSLNVLGNYSASGIFICGGNTIISGGGTISLANVSIPNLRTFSTGTQNLSISGNIYNNGTFQSNSLITLNGNGKIISGDTITQFYKLKVTGNITANSDISISDSFNVTNQFYSLATTRIVGVNPSALLGKPILTNVVLESGKMLRLTISSVLEIRGIFTNNGILETSLYSPNTVWFSSNSSSIPKASYWNLQLSGGNSKTATDTIIIKGDFIVDSSTVFDGGNSSVRFSGTDSKLYSTANGIVKFNNVIIDMLRSFNAQNFGIEVKGNWTNNGVFLSTGTVTFNGNSSQQISKSGFYNIVFSGNGNKNLISGPTTIDGNLTLNAGITFRPDTTTLLLKGNAINNGAVFQGGTSNFIFNASQNQTITGSFPFNNLRIHNPFGVNLNTSISVEGNLQTTSGKLITGNNDITLGNNGTLTESGQNLVLGKIKITRNVLSNSENNFGNIGFKMTAIGTAPLQTVVTRTTGTQLKGNGVDSTHYSIKRYFDISPQVNSNLNATITFYYDDTEIPLPHTEQTLRLWNSTNSGTTWNVIGGTVSSSQNSITKVGVNSLEKLTASSISLQPKTAVVRVYRDTDGIDSTINDWVSTNWNMEIKRGLIGGQTVAKTNSDTMLYVDTLSETSYTVTIGDSLNWYHKAYIVDTVLTKSDTTSFPFSFPEINVRTIKFSVFHPSKITMRMLKDLDGNFETTNDRILIKWNFSLLKNGILRKKNTNSFNLVDSLLEDYTFLAQASDSGGWRSIGYIINDTIFVDSLQKQANVYFNVANGGNITIDFINFASNTIAVRQLKDFDGNISTTNDRYERIWNLKLFDSTGINLITETNSKKLVINDLPDGKYYAVQAESLSWKPIGNILDGITSTDTTRKKLITISGGDSISLDFLSVHLNTIVIKNFKDIDNNFSNDTGYYLIPWNIKLRKNTLSGGSPTDLLLNIVSDTVITVPNLLNGTYYAIAFDSIGWKRFGYIKNGQKIISIDTAVQILFETGGEISTIYFVNSNADSASFRTLQQFSTTITGKPNKLKPKKGVVLVHNDANFKDTAFIRLFPKKPKTIMICGVNQIDTDSAKKYGWVEFKKSTNVAKYLPQNTEESGFDFFLNGKKFVKGLKNPKQTKYPNRLLAELILLKLNIAASYGNVTPNGFGDLIFNDNGNNSHFLNGKTIYEIAGTPAPPGIGMYHGFVDSVLTYYNGFGNYDNFVQPYFTNLADAIAMINNVFYDSPDVSDTISINPLKLKGNKQLSEVMFLTSNPNTKIFEYNFSNYVTTPTEFELYQNYPNPFNPNTTIEFYIPNESIVNLNVYNILGQKVKTILQNQFLESGFNEVEFDGSNLPSGIYFARIEVKEIEDEENVSNEIVKLKKMMLLK